MTTTRRQVMAVAAAGAAVPLAACGGSTEQVDSSQPVRIPVADVPEGGGLVMDGVVVTQPSAGEYKAFDARCPHQGCTVSEVTTRAIICPCHGSEFDPQSGDMTQGPATEGLDERTVTVEDDDVVVSRE
ncbi:Rieske (2Fe-2S) protein [Janibacter cremeus]|uniref:Cytochrome bc1 complex Rieske iron-sulfur subunit n=1 Tax=Janibacter cremeus TaxID=1285192 RepID=A0A852W0X3_9MICO|nr:Rieske Fe-S protein [Janibacter cremeus]